MLPLRAWVADWLFNLLSGSVPLSHTALNLSPRPLSPAPLTLAHSPSAALAYTYTYAYAYALAGEVGYLTAAIKQASNTVPIQRLCEYYPNPSLYPFPLAPFPLSHLSPLTSHPSPSLSQVDDARVGDTICLVSDKLSLGDALEPLEG